MIVVKVLLLLIIMLVPFLIGAIYKKKDIIDTYIMGQVTMWALFQIIAVPMINLRLKFNVLFVVYLIGMIVLSVLGARKIPEVLKELEKPKINPVLIFAVLVIIGQMGIYFIGQHIDLDDARWLAEANDALSQKYMLLHNPATGEYVGSFRGEVIKDVFSPWSLYIAFLARFTLTRPAIVAHTILAPYLLGLSYMVYHKMSKQLFKGDVEAAVFLLSVSIINMFFGGNTHTQSVMTMVRIWQGKAVVAAVIIPLILSVFLEVQDADTTEDWIFLIVTGCAGCLFSGMGIAISVIMIGVLGGYAIIGRWKRIPYWLIALVPSIICGIGYSIMKG